MRPDVPDSVVPLPDEMRDSDTLLNSLCQFDILYCLAVAAEGQHGGSGYPASAAMNQSRVDPAFVLIANNPAARRALFPNSDDYKVADALQEVFDQADNQSFQYGGYWGRLPDSVEGFVRMHRTEANP